MNSFVQPKLRNRRTGVEIELNANPFSIGRGLSCNYVLPSKTVSRVHCILERNDDNTWVLKDTSTNGTFINGKLLQHVKSPPLKDNDVISLELNSEDSYVFVNDMPNDGISDEQLCAIADTVLNEMEFLTSDPVSESGDDQLGATSLPPRDVPDSTVNPLLDHMYTAKSSNDTTKKARLGRSPRAILGTCTRRGSDNTPTTAEGWEPLNSNTVVRNEGGTSGVVNNASTEELDVDEVMPLTQSSDRTVKREKAVKNEEITISSSENNSDSPVIIEEACLAQPGPSTDKTEKPPEHQDNYEVMENELQCVICSELFIKALTLNCSHTFCKYCISMWNKNKSDCPICRTKITSTTPTIVLDNVIEKVIENSNVEIKEHRRTVLEERRKQEEEENKPPAEPQQPAGRGRGRPRGRNNARRARGGRGNRAPEAPRINVLDPVAINIGALVNNVIEVSSDSDWSSDTESMSSTDMQEEYDQDDWYDTRRSYWGGYGYCYRCGSPTHWANSCPNR